MAFGFVKRSTYDAAVSRADASGKALAEMTGELIDGMREMGFDPSVQPRFLIGRPETTAGKVLRLLRNAMADANARDIECETTRRERDEYRPDALKHRAARANLKQFRKPNGTTEAAASSQAGL